MGKGRNVGKRRNDGSGIECWEEGCGWEGEKYRQGRNDSEGN